MNTLSEKDKTEGIQKFLVSEMKDLYDKKSRLDYSLGSHFIYKEVFSYKNDTKWLEKDVIPERTEVINKIEKLKAYATLHNITL
ncbi:hypothetical protein FACS189472_15330 [Alphaproteobacteria bacterium]|nr:hypothetical protein FACS189472_15330 [Alphaproteobacteria bacterium]